MLEFIWAEGFPNWLDASQVDELKNCLCGLLDIKAVNKQEHTQHELTVKEYKVNENDHSLLGRLRKFQKELNEENK